MPEKPRKLRVLEFATLLLVSDDIDPLYNILNGVDFSEYDRDKWLVAYWCFYHAGLACQAVDSKDYWTFMKRVAAGGKEFPRGTERRHFRGMIAKKSVAYLQHTFIHPTNFMTWLVEAGPSATAVMDRVTEVYGFGQWIKWKVADMIERLGISPLEFDESNLDDMFISSRQGALKTCETEGLEQTLLAAHRYVMNEVGDYKAPPLYDRLVNVQETETIFCKWKSHLSGHYPIGKDTREIKEGLLRYARSRISQRLLKSHRACYGP